VKKIIPQNRKMDGSIAHLAAAARRVAQEIDDAIGLQRQAADQV
jgi:hypothetical protein